MHLNQNCIRGGVLMILNDLVKLFKYNIHYQSILKIKNISMIRFFLSFYEKSLFLKNCFLKLSLSLSFKV